MSLRIATFNAENLMQRFDFSGFKNEKRRDRSLKHLDIKDEKQFRRFEEVRTIAHTDDTLQLTALAIADCMADIVCLQEVENLEALQAFEYGYLFKMVGRGYLNKYLIEGNDSRGIDVAVLMREETADGQPIEFVNAKSHASVTYQDFDLSTKQLREMGEEPKERIFRRDCLELDIKIGGKPLTLFVTHLKSMGSYRDGVPGRDYTMPVRVAEAAAIHKIVTAKFQGKPENKRWLICGDLNDYRERVVVEGSKQTGFRFEYATEKTAGFDKLLENGFSENLVARRPKDDRWTLYHTRGPQEQHLVQLDYILASPEIARKNPKAVPDIIRNGQPYRTAFPPEQSVERYPRTGWDRPKSSDHCPVVVKLNII